MTGDITNMDIQAQLTIDLLLKVGAFPIKNGSLEIHFDAEGIPVKVEKREHYRLSTTQN